ncbi:hypothetical protein VOLCADRAFT_121244 [Volvox carteri f. nagariensis]|uniref:Aquaporin n=1 Tax=Volvox carteri f. nagariensis TaxID=3068 RepID=D8U5T1_VOLCA|nr:uncharacterized protein VOLCADRAFT_121244 [Volvox carteri f. nagariensis]EFJ45054.1 hypothetical protein VOLCADRAFT_121244 [Volvox carteri f. nagariensis]|eukprot:XP_002954025.1 hypothetical protein VOLCADRAFT_121244 [Volvox carteri f. nagariensis]
MAAAGLPEENDTRKRSLPVLVFGDFMVTALWVMASSCFAEASGYLAKYTGMDELVLGIGVLVTTLTLFGPLCESFGGALFNPIHCVALMSSGKGSIAGHLLRMGAQLAGALAGSLAAKTYLPDWLQGKFHTLSGGIKDGVAFEIGFACEGTMSFVLNYVFLLSQEADSRLLTLWTPMLSTVTLSWIGYYFTGPSLNPFVSFSWHLHYKRQNDLEHYLVFWSAPILGAVAAGLAFLFQRKPAQRKGRRPSKAAIAARGQKTLQQQQLQRHQHHNQNDQSYSNHHNHHQAYPGKETQ